MSANAPQVPLNPTVEEIRRLTQVKVSVYNPTDYTKLVEQYGDGYLFPPLYALPIANKLRYKMVHDVNPRSPSNAVYWHDPKAPSREKTADTLVAAEAAVIASAICEEERFGRVGFCVLLNDGFDEDRKTAARRKWLTYRLTECQGVELEIQQKVQMWQGAHPGTFPRLKKGQIEVLRWLKRYDSGEFEIFGQESEEQKEAIEMFLNRNPSIADAQGPAAAQQIGRIDPNTVSDVTPTRVPTPPAEDIEEEPEDAPGDAGLVLFKKAKDLGIKLTTTELEGLFADDDKVVARVARKVARNGG